MKKMFFCLFVENFLSLTEPTTNCIRLLCHVSYGKSLKENVTILSDNETNLVKAK